MLQKKSFFDILMSKNKPPPKNDENSTDKTIIVLDNSLNKTIDSNNENDCILIDDKNSDKKKSDSAKKVLNENLSSNTNNKNNSVNSPLKFRRKSSSKKLDKVFEKFLLDHVKQFTEQDNELLKELEKTPKIKLKEETPELDLSSFNLTKPLCFDFTDKLKDIEQCECKNELEKFSQEITFSLNNSLENLSPNRNDLNIRIETNLNIIELENERVHQKLNNPDDTINDADLTVEMHSLSNNSSPRRSIENIYGKRRKIDEINGNEYKTDIEIEIEKIKDTKTNESAKQNKKRGRPPKKKEENISTNINNDDENANLEPVTKNEPVYDVKKDETSNKNNGKKSDSQELWTEKYQFKNEDDIVTNNSQLERLKEWLNNWKTILSKDSSNTNTKQTKSYDSDSDYTYDSDTNSNSENAYSKTANGKKFYSNAILLSGPHGCGKTSSVHSIAKQLNFKVFEVNSSSLRCKSQIIQDLEGALNSHHVSNNSSGAINFPSLNKVQSATNTSTKVTKDEEDQKQQAPKSKSLESFFKLSSAAPKTATTTITNTTSKQVEKKPGKKRKNSLRRDTVLSVHQNKNKNDTDNNKSSSNNTLIAATINCASNEATSVNIHKESLILFDEIDVVFKEDVGFWAAVNHFIKRSKKPIILTTNDEFLQEKINLNVEKIEFIRPRIDASIRFLKSIAMKEKIDIDTHVAYKIIRECKCDMRRALVQLQLLLQKSSKSIDEENNNNNHNNSNQKILSNINTYFSTLDLNRLLSRSITNKNCKYHNENAYFNNIWFLDLLTKRLKYDQNTDLAANHLNNGDNLFKRYDSFILRDGLTDNTPANSSTSSSNLNGQSSGTPAVSAYNFNPFIPQSTQLKLDTSSSKSNAILVREHMFNIYDSFIKLFNDNKMIDFTEWSKHGQTNQFNYPCNVAINRFAQALFKFTSNESISLDYRPYLQQMCHYEKLKQQNFTGRRRYNHYFTYLNIGLIKDDYNLLAKSNLVDENPTILNDENDRNNLNKNDNDHSQDDIGFSQQSQLINADLFTTDS